MAIGIFRLALALVIVLVHATKPEGHAIASNAVFIFFALSGYGCTAAMQGRYKGKPIEFLRGRYLRLWPSYLVLFALTCVAWALVGDLHNIAVPSSPASWLGQLSMLWMPWAGRTVPTAWVLPYLFAGYAAIAFGATATPRRAMFCLVLSFPWMHHDALVMGGGQYAGSLGAWALSTAVGAAAYWLNPDVPAAKGWAAEIAFPIFLCHYLVVALLMAAGMVQGWTLFVAVLLPTLALSWLMVVAVERPVDRFRRRLTA